MATPRKFFPTDEELKPYGYAPVPNVLCVTCNRFNGKSANPFEVLRCEAVSTEGRICRPCAVRQYTLVQYECADAGMTDEDEERIAA